MQLPPPWYYTGLLVQNFGILHTNQPNGRYNLNLKRENATWLLAEAPFVVF
jgi:hypothetical protein